MNNLSKHEQVDPPEPDDVKCPQCWSFGYNIFMIGDFEDAIQKEEMEGPLTKELLEEAKCKLCKGEGYISKGDYGVWLKEMGL